MKTFKCFRIGMIGMVVLIALSFSARAFAAIDAYLWITDSTGKTIKVKIHHDGSFTTPVLHAGTYRWSFGATQSGVASSPNGSTGKTSSSDLPKESITLNFTKITMTYSIVPPIDHNSGATTGKRQYKPITITKEVDQASPKAMTNLGMLVIDANGETISGTITPMNKNGGKTAMDDWTQ
jgi:hypothetical protein